MFEAASGAQGGQQVPFQKLSSVISGDGKECIRDGVRSDVDGGRMPPDSAAPVRVFVLVIVVLVAMLALALVAGPTAVVAVPPALWALNALIKS